MVDFLIPAWYVTKVCHVILFCEFWCSIFLSILRSSATELPSVHKQHWPLLTTCCWITPIGMQCGPLLPTAEQHLSAYRVGHYNFLQLNNTHQHAELAIITPCSWTASAYSICHYSLLLTNTHWHTELAIITSCSWTTPISIQHWPLFPTAEQHLSAYSVGRFNSLLLNSIHQHTAFAITPYCWTTPISIQCWPL